MARKSSFVTAVQKSRSHVRLEGHYCNIGLRVRTNISTNTNTRTSNIKQLISTIVSNMPYKNHITCEIGAKPRQCTKKKEHPPQLQAPSRPGDASGSFVKIRTYRKCCADRTVCCSVFPHLHRPRRCHPHSGLIYNCSCCCYL